LPYVCFRTEHYSGIAKDPLHGSGLFFSEIQ